MTERLRLQHVVLVFFGLALGLGLAEASLRLLALVPVNMAQRLAEWDPIDTQIEPHGELGYRQRRNAAFHYINGTVAHSNAQAFRGDTVVIPKPAGLFRVVLLGGSATHGWGVADDETIDTHLRALLRQRLGGPVDVVNLAFDAYDAYQVYERLVTDGVALDPDVIIVNTGINDVRNAKIPNLRDRDPRTLIWEGTLARLRAEGAGGGPSVWTRLKHYSYVLRIPGFLRAQKQRGRDARSAHRREPNPQAIERFAMNVARVDSVAAANDIAVLYSTPPSALAWYNPQLGIRVSYWLRNAAGTQAYRDSMSLRLQVLARDRATAGAPVRYVEHSLDSTLFLDDVHLTSEGNYQMALDFADAIEQLLGSEPAVSTGTPSGTLP